MWVSLMQLSFKSFRFSSLIFFFYSSFTHSSFMPCLLRAHCESVLVAVGVVVRHTDNFGFPGPPFQTASLGGRKRPIMGTSYWASPSPMCTMLPLELTGSWLCVRGLAVALPVSGAGTAGCSECGWTCLWKLVNLLPLFPSALFPEAH